MSPAGGRGSSGTTDTPLEGRGAPFIREGVVAPDASVADGFRAGVMPDDSGDRVSREDLDALVTYLAVRRADAVRRLPCRRAGRASPMPDKRSSTSVTLTTGGITLLGVLLSVGVSVAFGVKGPWWLRVLAGLGTTVLLVVAVKLGTASGRGPLARAANWIIGSD